MMMNIQTVWLFVVHYGYTAVIEFVVELGDQFVTHFYMVLVLKAGAVHVGWIAVKRVRKYRAGKK